LSHKQQHWVDAIRGSGQLLLSTINDVLDFSKIEAGHLRLEAIHFSLGEVMSNLLNATAQRAYAKGLELVLYQEYGLPDQYIGDPFRIQQILINLVGNAIKFTERGTVKISLEKRELPGNRLLLCVSVRDSGVGIAPEQIQRVFQPFEQGTAHRFLFSEGTGLGLAICKRLVDAMEGSIGAESGLGEGSLFHFEVPVGLTEPQRSRWLLPESWEHCSARVWVQHEAVRESIIASLRAFGFKTHAVRSVAEATEPCSSAPGESTSCLLVLDEHLIGPQGASLLSELKARDGATALFCLYVANPFNHDKGELDRLDGLPNTAYVMKPVHASSLFNALQELFGFSSKSRNPSATANDPSWETLIRRLHVRERLSGARILLVEDNLVNQEVAVEALSMAGIEVQIATHGQEAVDLLSVGYQYDAVLMDLQMPVMDGFQATQIIRQQYAMDALPIIAMTAGVLFRDRQRSLEVGMNDHVGKPVNMQNLLETLLKWVQPAHPRPFVGQPSESPDRSPLESALAGAAKEDGEVDWDSVELPGLKIYRGLNRLGGSKKLYFKLLKSFAKAHEPSETELLASLSNRDFKTMHRLAHTLKGVALTIGAERLHRSALLVEKKALEALECDDPSGPPGRLDPVREAVEALIVDLHEAMHSVHSLLKSMRPAEQEALSEDRTAQVTAGTSAELYAQILVLLNHSDTRLQEVCTANPTTVRGWFDTHSNYAEFIGNIERYHFEEARDIFLSHAQASTP
jgi:CheY-like chemotaxis protein/anti-sigma regulatory factor (Ser/Thr protein kinase)